MNHLSIRLTPSIQWGGGMSITNRICDEPYSLAEKIKDITTEPILPAWSQIRYSDIKAYQDYHEQVGFTPLSPHVIKWLKKAYSRGKRSVQFVVPTEFQKYDLVLKNLISALEQATQFNSTNGIKIAFVKKQDTFARRYDSEHGQILLDGDNSPSDLAVTVHEAGHTLSSYIFPHPFHLEEFPFIDTIYNNIMSYHWDDGQDPGPSTLSDKDLEGVSPICKNLARTFGTVLGVVLPEVYGHRVGAPNCTEELNKPQYHSKIFDAQQDHSFLGQFSNFLRNFFHSRKREEYYASFYNAKILNILSMRLLIINHLIDRININSNDNQALFLLEATLESAALSPWELSAWEKNVAEHYHSNNRIFPSLKNMIKAYDTPDEGLGCKTTLKKPLKYDDFKKIALITASSSLGLLLAFGISVIGYKCWQERSNNFFTDFRGVRGLGFSPLPMQNIS